MPIEIVAHFILLLSPLCLVKHLGSLMLSVMCLRDRAMLLAGQVPKAQGRKVHGAGNVGEAHSAHSGRCLLCALASEDPESAR